MSARRFRHRDRQQVRPGLPQLGPGLGAHRPACRIRVSGILCPHTPPPGSSDMGHTPGIRHSGFPVAYASGISDTAHHGHRVPEHRAHAGHWRQAHRAPGCIRFGNQVSRVPDIRRCRASCVGHEKVGHEKGESGIGFPFGRPCCARIPGGGAISSRAGRSTRASTYRP